jgi:hypothetical protein
VIFPPLLIYLIEGDPNSPDVSRNMVKTAYVIFSCHPKQIMLL